MKLPKYLRDRILKILLSMEYSYSYQTNQLVSIIEELYEENAELKERLKDK